MTPARRDSSRMISAGIQNQPDCQVAGLASRDSQHQLFQIYFIYRCQYLVEKDISKIVYFQENQVLWRLQLRGSPGAQQHMSVGGAGLTVASSSHL